MAYEKVRISELPPIDPGTPGLEVVGISNGHTVRALVSTAAAISGELEQKVKELQAAINEANQLRATLEETIMQLLGDEEAERREEDASIRQEVKRVSKALGDGLGAEIAARAAGDGQLAGAIHAEGQQRITAINTLHGRIAQERQAREAADSELSRRIDGISGAYDWGKVIEVKVKELEGRMQEKHQHLDWIKARWSRWERGDENHVNAKKSVVDGHYVASMGEHILQLVEALQAQVKALNGRDVQHRRMLLECKEHVKTLEARNGIKPDWEPESDWK